MSNVKELRDLFEDFVVIVDLLSELKITTVEDATVFLDSLAVSLIRPREICNLTNQPVCGMLLAMRQ